MEECVLRFIEEHPKVRNYRLIEGARSPAKAPQLDKFGFKRCLLHVEGRWLLYC